MRVNHLESWHALERDAQRLRNARIETLFESDPQRLDHLALEAAGLYLDVSKNLIDAPVVTNLLRLAQDRKLAQAIEALFCGGTVNPTENRPALHTLLRSTTAGPSDSTMTDRFAQVREARRQIGRFSERLMSGEIVGHSGSSIRDVVNIGIGGSHLGPQLVCDALRYERNRDVDVHFVSNVDGGDLDRVLAPLNPESTYFIIASKSFNTAETLLNARSASAWIQRLFNDPFATAKHFAAVTSKPERAVEFGIERDSIFPMWDWVGGRYSLWSAIGLPIAIALGSDGFNGLLAGAEAMDRHFRSAELARNVPVLLALVGIWNTNFQDCETLAVVPYDDRLRQLPEYLQQLEMESNGKRISLENQITDYATAPVLWGGVGTNVQHAFFQQLHQGTRRTATEFIMVLAHQRAAREHQDMLVANCVAQAEGLMRGRARVLVADIESPSPSIDLPLHRESPGNRPTTMLVLDALTPQSLGALLALYEHKTYVQGVIWDIDPFDQWGVELGKVLADSILDELGSADPGPHDPSTRALLARYRRLRDS